MLSSNIIWESFNRVPNSDDWRYGVGEAELSIVLY